MIWNALPTSVAIATPQVEILLKVLVVVDKPLARNEIQNQLILKDRESFCERYLKPALDQELIEMTIPNSRIDELLPFNNMD
jgi:hypothetical protein